LHQSHNQAANHLEKWKWWTFFPHYSHPPYRAFSTSKKVPEQEALAVLGVVGR
jgi:hypothetical protein